MASFNFLKSSSLILALFIFSQFSLINAHYKDEGLTVDLSERSLIVVKIWCSIILFLATFLCGLISYPLRSNTNFLVLGNQFAGGVFMAISIHFVADSADIVNDYLEGSSTLTFIFVLIGYAITLFVETIVLKVKNKKRETNAFVQAEEGRKADEVSVANTINTNLVKRTAVEVAVILLLGLALHSAFEGISIGLAERPRYAWRYTWEISIHKIFLAIALGIVTLRMQPKRPFLTMLTYSFAFAISTPIGVIVSLLIKESAQSEASDWVYALTQAMACGAFLHMSLYHLLGKGFRPQDNESSYNTPFRRFFALFFGLVGIVIGMIFD